MGRLGLVALGAVVAGLLVLPEGRASLHHPDEPMAVPVSAAGVPEPLPFDEFGRRRLVLMNAGNAAWPLERVDPTDPAKKTRSDRGVLKDRIDKRLKLRDRSEVDNVALAVDWLRFGQPDEAAAALKGTRRGFLPNITLAHIAVAQNTREHPTWGQAFEYLDIANAEPQPKQFPGLTPQQLAWQLKLNRGALLKFVQLRMQEARTKPVPENELPDALFPVNFADTPDGLLSPAERAKLPADALATVQQLILWFPHDTRMYWLLAEVYAARGEFGPAQKIMDECVSSLSYSNRKILMQHREAVAKAAKAQGGPPPDEPLFTTPEVPPAPDVPFTLRTVWLYFAAVGAVALFAGVRALVRWRRGKSR